MNPLCLHEVNVSPNLPFLLFMCYQDQVLQDALLTIWLLVLVVEYNVGGMVEPSCQVGDRTVAKFVDPEDSVVDVGNTVDVVFKNVNAERVAETWGKGK